MTICEEKALVEQAGACRILWALSGSTLLWGPALELFVHFVMKPRVERWINLGLLFI